MKDALARSHRQAEATTAAHAKSFYFASRFLPLPKRRAVFALYDFCRHADDLVDERGERPVAAVRADLARLETMLRAVHRGDRPDDERWLALHDTLRRYPVPLEPLVELLEGVAIDLGPVEFETFAELHRYCRLVAGGVGLMLGPVLGAAPGAPRDAGIRLGVAMQLTNILRDLGEDLARDRLYIPREELRRFGLLRADLARSDVSEPFVRFMRWQVARARRAFADADVVIGLFPRDGSRLTVRLMQQTYAAILDAIEGQRYDVFRKRAQTGTARKLAILAQALLHERCVSGLHPTQHSA